MAQAHFSLNAAEFSCSICLEVLKDPVSIPCGHSFCQSCLTSYWDSQMVCSCPHCRVTFSPRPTLGRNTLLTQMIQRLAAAQLSEGPSAPPFYQDPPFSMTQGFEHPTFDVSSVHAGRTSGEHRAKEAVKDASRIFAELQTFLERRRVEVKALIRAQEKAESTRCENLLHHLEGQICQLKERDAALQGAQDQHLTNTFCSPAAEEPSLTLNPHASFGSVRRAISDMKDHLQTSYQAHFTNISTAVKNVNMLQSQKSNRGRGTVKKSYSDRSDLLPYFHPLSWDPFTAHQELSLSAGNRAVGRTGEVRSYPVHPERFDSWAQAMCREGLQGRCYWEADWGGQQVALGLAYENMKRKGTSNDSRLGHNSLSWSLLCGPSTFTFTHGDDMVSIPAATISRKIGVFLDHDAGVLCFYSVTPAGIQLLHQIESDFDQPLYPTVWLGPGASVNLTCVD
ncbi:tripartite motif-containing protein 16-like protein isoform X2 [Nerophis ophidion]|uniref:tripartite motif-containing protein 16-like protein isoform X2 n=1 Tax=Nerophis ophidion TaxID=159077 RepID=UPI002ADF5B40|nr:tripartite motif-containing protein 16-like protein isoform X2 [Nerophis ophidion]